MKFLCVLCVLCGVPVSAFALDREAFTFTKYFLNVRIDPEQHRLEVRGKITLRNDSSAPQKDASLQISTSLDWRSIRVAGKPVQFVSQRYTSDIDHTGALSEAIVALPEAVPPQGTVELDIGYEGVIILDTTRLTRIGVPEEQAKHTDWDQIGPSFTAVRGVGYVAWYPVAMEAASLSVGDSVPQTIERWKARHFGSDMSLFFAVTSGQAVWSSGARSLFAVSNPDLPKETKFGAFSEHFTADVPVFVVADYQKLGGDPDPSVYCHSGNEAAASAYVDAIARIKASSPRVGREPRPIQVLQLADPEAAPFTTGAILLTPLAAPLSTAANLTLVYAIARHSILSRRAWIREGLAHYTQAVYIEQQDGRQAALNYLNAHRDLLVEAERQALAKGGTSADKRQSEIDQSLINTSDSLYLETKAVSVWWMLRDMIGESALETALAHYWPERDKEASWMQRLIEGPEHRDLEWFFDDWVYRDRGLPDFRVESVYPRQTMQGNYMVTVTIENLGGAGAEVPVTVRTKDEDVTKRLEVRAKSRNSIRIEVQSPPVTVVVNDGSVPESDMSNNTFKVPAGTEAR